MKEFDGAHIRNNMACLRGLQRSPHHLLLCSADHSHRQGPEWRIAISYPSGCCGPAPTRRRRCMRRPISTTSGLPC